MWVMSKCVKAVAVSSVGASWVDARCVTVRRAVFWQSRYVKLCPVEVCFGSQGKSCCVKVSFVKAVFRLAVMFR
jgi:hypothetical protein